jgi:4-diphosphocytidyl-2-C-methyl-D-erythritol kinase
MEVHAHAKINLNLRVLDLRPDGYHEIETLMVPVGLRDTLVIEPAGELRVECDDPALPTGPANLAGKAAMAFLEHTGVGGGVAIQIRKAIPTGAGLGGGSSDAVAVLEAMDRLFGTGLAPARLRELAAGIGSDCAWFVDGVAAVCCGRGEQIGPPVSVPRGRVLLLKPPFGVPTPWAYAALAAARKAGSARDVEVQQLAGIGVFNDFEGPVFSKFALLGVLKDWLRERPGVRAAGMSGSGAALFAVMEGGADAEDLAGEARKAFGESLWTHSTFFGSDVDSL